MSANCERERRALSKLHNVTKEGKLNKVTLDHIYGADTQPCIYICIYYHSDIVGFDREVYNMAVEGIYTLQ